MTAMLAELCKFHPCRRVLWAALLPVCLALAADTLPPPAKTPVDFARDVEPLLRARCELCHGARQQMKGLRQSFPDKRTHTISF
jgi:hypothetical protein